MTTPYLRQLRAGVDFGADTPYAKQMQNFVYVVGDRDTGEALLVDPAWAVAELVEAVQADGMRVTGALVTHYHPDHIGGDLWGIEVDGLATLMEVAPCPVHVHRLEADGVRQVSGLSTGDLVKHDSGDKISVGGLEIELLHTPGHTPGSQCFRCAGALISGDTLFLQGCGRVDLPGADPDAMFRSLRRLRELPGDLLLYPGHGYGGAQATMEQVGQLNPYLQIEELADWQQLMGRG